MLNIKKELLVLLPGAWHSVSFENVLIPHSDTLWDTFLPLYILLGLLSHICLGERTLAHGSVLRAASRKERDCSLSTSAREYLQPCVGTLI